MGGSHGFDHTERVIKLCIFLGEKLGADMEVLIPAAILHDIARSMKNHSIASARKSENILRNYNIEEDKIRHICEAIRTHSFSGGRKAKTIEAKILSDADKLDALGAVGILRTAMYSGETSRSLDDFLSHFDDKLLKLKDLMYTDEGYKVALIRHKYILDYLKRIQEEIELKDF
jgi:uncharacterized protein